VLKTKVPGKAPTDTIIVGTTFTPEPHPGKTVAYEVRARARLLWSNEVSITYPPRSGEGGRRAREAAEREAREQAEREAKEKAEREAKEKAEREAKEKAERVAKEKAEREAKERAEREAKEKAEREARERAEREAREKAEREAKEREEAEHGKGGLTFTPAAIQLSAPEIPNSGRGLYDWEGEHSMTPAGWPLVDYYGRDEITWSQMETSKGVYDFTQIRNVLAKAQAKGGRARIRIMAYMLGSTNREPGYIPLNPGGWPEFNSEVFQQSWEALWKAMGEQFGNDPRLAWIDVGGYGEWGEFHMAGIFVQGSHLTTANGLRMTGAIVKAFPKAHVVLSTGAAVKSNEGPLQPELLPAIVKAFPTVGYHFDNYGASAPGDGNNLPFLKPGDLAPNEEAWTRWKAAPVIAEWWNLPLSSLAEAKRSEEEFHVSLIGSGNNPAQSWKTNPALYEEIVKRSGFRYQLDKVTVPSTFTRGAGVTVGSTWENVNVAPTYDPWQVTYELLGSAGTVSWSGASTLDLRAVVPTNGTPVVHTDSLTVPSTVPPGSYTLAVAVNDPNHYLAPMRLADQGRASDGSYPLGTVTVG
jgi:hypothetical protein